VAFLFENLRLALFVENGKNGWTFLNKEKSEKGGIQG
jgi:hypothetical protein